MSFIPFDLEYIQSKWEQVVDFNLTESGVHPLRVEELLADSPGSLESLLATEINYPHVNGNPDLRENIARLYGADVYDAAYATELGIDNVLVTVGAAEANNIIVQT